MRARRVARAAVLATAAVGVGAAAVSHGGVSTKQAKKQPEWVKLLNGFLPGRAKHHQAPVVIVVCWKRKKLAQGAHLNVAKADLAANQELGYTKKYSFHIIYVRNSPPKGIYKVAVDFKGQHFHTCHSAKPVVSVWDFRQTHGHPSAVRTSEFKTLQVNDQQLPVNNWLVGSFVVDGNLFGWQQKFNTIIAGYPNDWNQLPPQTVGSILAQEEFDSDSDSDDEDDGKVVIQEITQPNIVVASPMPPPVNPQYAQPPPGEFQQQPYQQPYQQQPYQQQTYQQQPYQQQPYPQQYPPQQYQNPPQQSFGYQQPSAYGIQPQQSQDNSPLLNNNQKQDSSSGCCCAVI